jgi:hypothetical protein
MNAQIADLIDAKAVCFCIQFERRPNKHQLNTRPRVTEPPDVPASFPSAAADHVRCSLTTRCPHDEAAGNKKM